jgi:arylsulfatase A-like enzyme
MKSSFSHSISRSLLFVAAASLSLFFVEPVRAANVNVLIVIADDFGVDAAPGYATGLDKPPMPNLTSLQSTGVTFTRAWSNPLCSPTRATLLSGRYGFRTGVQYVALPTNRFGLRPNEPSIPKALDSIGIPSAAFGKWHLADFGNFNPTPADHPIRMGFDRYAGDLTSTLAPSYTDWPKVINTTTEIEQRSQARTYATTDVTNEALSWIQAQGTGNWCAWVAYNAPHSPYHRPPDNLHSFDSSPATLRNHYKAMCEALDTEMGRLINGLSPAVRSRTMIVFVGDNGTPADVKSGGYRGSKFGIYEGGINVPLVVSGFGVGTPNTVNNSLINTSDLFATIMDVHDINVDDVDEGMTMDTISFLPSVTNSAVTSARTTAFSDLRVNGTPTLIRTVRNNRYKLLRFGSSSSLSNFREEFYDLQVNPLETATANILLRTRTAAETTNLTNLTNQLNALSR